MISMGTVDYAIIILYFVMLLVVGYFIKKKVKGVNDFFLAGRRLTLPMFIATLVSTWYGGLLGVGEFTFNYGLANWVTQAFFWYIAALIFAFFLAARIRKSNLYTIPDQLERFYGKGSRFLGAILNFIMVTPAPYVLSLGKILGLLFGFDIWVGVVVATAFLLFYTMRGGFFGVIYTDFVQFMLMMSGVALVVPFAVSKFGGFSFLQANLPELHLSATGGLATQYILVWGFIAFWTLVDPGFYQRCYAAKNSKIPKKGIIIAVLFWFLFDICTTFTGLYARAAMPGIEATTSYAVFASSVLPPVITGLFFAGLIATIMSTIDSFTLLGAMNISHDLFKNIFKKNASEKQVLIVTKIGILFTGAVAMAVALYFNSLIGMWYTIGTIGISGLLVPILFGFFYKAKKSALAGFWSIIAGALTSTIWIIQGQLNKVDEWPSYWLGIEPMYPGLSASLIVFIIIHLTERAIGDKSWT